MTEINKYVKIVLISTFEKPKTLVEISNVWFKNKGRLYQPKVMNEIKKAVKNKLLIKKRKFYEPNFSKLIELLFAKYTTQKVAKIIESYKQKLEFFYTHLGDYTRQTYLNFEIIKMFTNLDQRKAAELDLKMLIQLPHFLRLGEETNRSLTYMLIRFVMDWEEYLEIISKLEIQNYHILKEKKLVDDFVESFEWFANIAEKADKETSSLKKNVEAMKVLGR